MEDMRDMEDVVSSVPSSLQNYALVGHSSTPTTSHSHLHDSTAVKTPAKAEEVEFPMVDWNSTDQKKEKTGRNEVNPGRKRGS